MASELFIYCDGASRGNPGPAAFGVVGFQGKADYSLNAFKANENIAAFVAAEKLGVRTNNEAEYAAIIFALEKCVALAAVNPTIFSDSELVIKQLRGEYRVKGENLKPLFTVAQKLVSQIKPCLVHVPREKNQIADFLANRALDRG
ncbi:MAG: ribonuclease HI family protein [Spirochaetes bacterium]|nr:ribonuclease HI family protein [Spirochaetota bacterium]